MRVNATAARSALRVAPAALAASLACLALVAPSRAAAATFAPQGPKLTGALESGKGQFGRALALSSDGNTAIVGAPVDGSGVGAAWVFTRSGSTWTQQGSKLTGGEEAGKGHFGVSVALSSDGNTALIGGGSDDGEVGAAWVFTRSGSTWTQQGAKLSGGEESGEGHFGNRVALSSDGNTALIGGPYDDAQLGAAWAFTRSAGAWEQEGPKLTASGENGQGEFGAGLALSADGKTALIGAGADNAGVGAVWTFARAGSSWSQQGSKLTAQEEIGAAHFGFALALSSDASTALVGGGSDNNEVGAAWAYTRTASAWQQQGAKLTGDEEVRKGHFGFRVALSSDGEEALIGGPADSSERGAAWAFTRPETVWEPLGSKLTGAGESGSGGFGEAVALSGDGLTALVGGGTDAAEAGAAWPFLSSAPPAKAPTVVTEAASAPTQTSVTLRGSVNPNGANVEDCHFDYGTTTSYGSKVSCSALPGSGSAAVSVSAPLSALSPGTPYYFRLVASNAQGTSSDPLGQTFTTEAAPAEEPPKDEPAPEEPPKEEPPTEEPAAEEPAKEESAKETAPSQAGEPGEKAPPKPPLVAETLLSETAAPAGSPIAGALGVLPFHEVAPVPLMRLLATSLTVSREGLVRVGLICPSDESSCSGTLSLKGLGAGSFTALSRFTVAGGHTKLVGLHLSSRTRSRLARVHALRARATVAAHDPAGARHTTLATVTLRAAKAAGGPGHS